MNTYQNTLEFLYSQLPQYQKTGSKAYKANLDNIKAICSVLGNPHRDIKTIHVAGSNGKGSTSHMLASILQEAGYKVGLYTSPHLKDFRERIKINGQEISEERVVEFVTEFQPQLKPIRPSFFEWTVGLAFYYFKEQQTDINIIETGLGGRLDSTNIITPEISVITNISLEHTAILGDTLELITKEKAGIIKKETPVVIGETHPITQPIFEEIAENLKSPIAFADINIEGDEYDLDLKGSVQQKNAKTAIQTILQLQVLGWEISTQSIIDGLNSVIKNTGLIGRFQIVDTEPTVIYDTAHNPDGIKVLANEVSKINYNQLHVVIGMAEDKNHEVMLNPFPKETRFYFCSSTNSRVLKGEKLAEIAKQLEIVGNAYISVNSALNQAKKKSKPEDIILVTGSNFVVADIL